MLSTLTSRERQVAEAVWCGLSNKEIARDLGISVNTVSNLVSSIISKLAVDSRSGIVRKFADDISHSPKPVGATEWKNSTVVNGD
jgi:DNA-binding NarL/FixJ family response regulator